MKAHTISQKQIVPFLAEQHGLSKAESYRILKSLQDYWTIQLEKGERVHLSGFGTFETRTTPAHTGRNPMTGGALEIPEKRKVRFRPAAELQRALNGQ